jgi:hypothetical protein
MRNSPAPTGLVPAVALSPFRPAEAPMFPKDLAWPYLSTILILMAVVLGTAMLIMAVGRWIKRPPSSLGTAGEELTSLRVLYERGEFSQEEYDRIRARLKQRLRKETGVPAPAPADLPAAAAPEGSGLPAANPDLTIVRTDDPGGAASDNSIKPPQAAGGSG